MSKHAPGPDEAIGHPVSMDWVETALGRTLRITVDFPGEDSIVDFGPPNVELLRGFIAGEEAPGRAMRHAASDMLEALEASSSYGGEDFCACPEYGWDPLDNSHTVFCDMARAAIAKATGATP